MLNIVIFGPPGSGKGTQSQKIAEKYQMVHLSTGDLLREEIKNETELGKQVKSYIDKGMLVPDEIIMKELQSKASEHIDAPGLLFDGFPRTIAQADMLDKMLENENISIDLVLNIEVDDEEITKRMIGRASESNRSDDTEDVIKSRIETYKQQSYPVINYYKKQGKIVNINGQASVDKVFEDICNGVDAYKSGN